MQPVLNISGLSVQFKQDGKKQDAVHHFSLDLFKGKITALVGESGSGKSVTALSILGLLPKQASIGGQIQFNEPSGSMDISRLDQKSLNSIRGKRIAMIFQEPMTSLNPVIRCGEQVAESIRLHQKVSPAEAKKKTIELFKKVELPLPEAMYKRYPHQLSGGQKQRVMIAMAICCEPALLIADEPTTALDVRVQKSIMELLKKLQLETGMGILLITHDLGLVADYADYITVMHKGKIVEQGNCQNVLLNPAEAYTKLLLASKPRPAMKGKPLPTPEGYNAANNTEFSATVKNISDDQKSNSVLEVQNLCVEYSSAGFMNQRKTQFKAIDNVSFEIHQHETVGLVGESGCGKTTLGKAILQLIKPSEGKILFNGKDLTSIRNNEQQQLRKELQVVFQDPYGSLNPRLTIGDAIMEPMKVHRLFNSHKHRRDQAAALLEKVNLNPDHLNRHPHQFSGGQRQRICIARALATEPSFLVFDESVSALDTIVQAQVLNLINELKTSYNFTSLFISHDLSVIHYISDRILVMQQGKIVEQGTADEIMFNPVHDYTKELIASIPGKSTGFSFYSL